MHRPKLALVLMATLAVALAAGRSDAQTLTTLTSFDSTDGNGPTGALALSGSTLYGATIFGGTGDGDGTLFSLPVTGGTPTTLVSFNGTNGNYGWGGVTLSPDGSTVYAMAQQGGAGGYGTALSVPAAGGNATTLFSFDVANGAGPVGPLTVSPGGAALYGVAQTGGTTGDGVIFSVPAFGGEPNVLATFNGTDGARPYGELTLVGATLYGTTSEGGAYNEGEVFSIPVTGGIPTVLASFNITDGYAPQSPLLLIGNTLYGTAPAGGPSNDGVVFSVPLTGGSITDLATFNGTDGVAPFFNLLLSPDKTTFYGTTLEGGANNEGVVFSLPVTGGTPTVLTSFDGTNGSQPYGDIVLSPDGNTIYGTTENGGASGDGTVFALVLTPEPSSVVLLGLGGIGIAVLAVRRNLRKRLG